VQSHIRLGLQDGAHLVYDLEDRNGEAVGHVLATRAHAGQGEQLAKACGDPLVAPHPDHGVVGGVGVYPEALQNLLSEFPVHALLEGALPVGQQILVDPAEGDSRPRVVLVAHDEHVIEPEGLHRLPKGSCRLPWDPLQVGCHLLELFRSCRVLFLRSQLLAFLCVPGSQVTGHGRCRHHGPLRTAPR